MNKKEFFKERIDKIAKESFNSEQKVIAKKIIENTDDKDLDAVWGLISQRVKTGFVFDEAPEINHDCVAYIKENEKLGINVGKENTVEHSLIIGENYDALKNLVATYTDNQGNGLIDMIYIDPPYNTEKSKEEGNDYKEKIEAKKFVYRDKFTRDGWLNMMNERLKIAKKILSNHGVLFISIDDYEQAYLKILCDEIFGEQNCDTMIWRKSGVGRDGKMKNTTTFRKDHEYIIVCFKHDLLLNKSFEFPNWENEYNNQDNDPRGSYKAGSISNKEEASNPNSPNFYSVVSPSGKVFTRQFNISKEEFLKLDADNRIYWGKNNDAVPSQKIFVNEKRSVTTSSYIDNINDIDLSTIDNKECTTTKGSKELDEILGIEGIGNKMRPKPVQLLYKLCQIASNKDSIILDFFAGSGTTGQAVMELNEEDGGNRKFILVTNNENNIAKDVTRERLYRVIKGVGSKGEKFEWSYSKDKKNLGNNSLRVFDIVKQNLSITDIDKAEKIKMEAEGNFVKLNPNYKSKSDMDIYNVLASLTPYKNESED